MERVPPNSLEAEMAVLGSVLLDGEMLGNLVTFLKPEDFYKGAHRTIYEVMTVLFDGGSPIDAILVFREIERQGRFDEVGGAEYLASLPESVVSPANAEHYARIVHEKAIARRLITVATEIQQAAYREEGSGEELLEFAESSVFQLSESRTGNEPKNVRSLLNETFEELERGEGPLVGVESGFGDLDHKTGGFRAGELIIIAARPSMGKTSLALNMAANAGIRGGKSVAVFTLEMTAKNVVRNMLCSFARFNAHEIRQGRFVSDTKRADLAQAAGPLFEANIFVDDSPMLNPTMLRSKARRLKAKYGLDMIIIDYLQLMDAGSVRRSIDNREKEISYISRSLKGLALELEVPVIALSQLNREAERGAEKGDRPKLAHLRESGAIEQDADVICLLYRKHYYTKNPEDENKAILDVAKQRNGPTGDVKLHFHPQWMLFTEPAMVSMPGQ